MQKIILHFFYDLNYAFHQDVYFVSYWLFNFTCGCLFGCRCYFVADTRDKKSRFNFTKEVYNLSNDVHTDLVLPVKSDIQDWTALFPAKDTKSQDSTYAWIGIGCGDKGFYLNTPEWKDLTFKTAFVAAVGIVETALHVTYHPAIAENNLC